MRGPLNLDAEVARDATYGDIRSRLVPRNDLVLSVAWDDDQHPFQEIEIHLREEDKRHIVGAIIGRDKNATRVVRLEDVPEIPGRYKIEGIPNLAPQEISVTMDGLCPRIDVGQGYPKDVVLAVETLASRITSLQSAVFWLGAVRKAAKRKMPYRGDPSRIDGLGTNAWDKLAYDARGGNVIFPRVRGVIAEMFEHDLVVRDDGAEFAIEVELPTTGNSPNRVSIVDTGEGVTQVLPVLVLGAMAEANLLGEGAVLAIEQPEMHLHPKAEHALAKFLVDIARSPTGPRILLETHSENLLLFLQLEVARKHLKAEDVSVLWMRALGDRQTETTKVGIDEQGRLKDWPEGVFSEDVEIARQLFMARRGAHR